jgi:hypothetical protein
VDELVEAVFPEIVGFEVPAVREPYDWMGGNCAKDAIEIRVDKRSDRVNMGTNEPGEGKEP